MTRILTPISGKTATYLNQVCARYFREALSLRVVQYGLGNSFTGRIDLLATDGTGIQLITIGTADFPNDLLRSLTGYRWFRENRVFLQRLYVPDEIDLGLPVSLVVLTQAPPPDAGALCRELLTVPVQLLTYRLYGSGEDPDISVERIPDAGEGAGREDFGALRRELGIEAAGLTDQDIRDFRQALGF